ncbi:MAG: hypothetical protein NPINA01_07140 [Nitrospinaceae bacterium]|nr:MAG: hypothetical protein NPINA01_07140 [Nitrospinaceae bacterium]
MELARILEDSDEVGKKLKKMGLVRSDLIKVIHDAVLARNSCTDNDAANAPGSLAYFAGTRSLREILRSQGWQINRKDSVEGIVNSIATIKIIFQNVDRASEKNWEPRARSKKGPGSERTVSNNQGILFSEEEINRAMPANKTSAWYLCVSENQGIISAELSLPKSVDCGQFSGFLERIFLLQDGDGDLPEFSLSNFDDGDDGDFKEFEVNIARK